MKKLFSIVLMVLVAACMTGCSLHGGHGHGPNVAGGEGDYSLRGSIPASTFEASMRGALRAVEKTGLKMKLGDHVLDFDANNSTNDVYMFVKAVTKAALEALNGQEVEMSVYENGKENEPIVSQQFTLPEDFGETADDATEGNAAVVINKNLEVSVVTAVEAVAKTIAKLIEEVKSESNKTVSEKAITKAVEGKVEVKPLTVKFKVNGNELSSGATIKKGDEVVVETDPQVFSGNDEHEYLKYLTLSLTAKSKNGTEVVVSKYGDDTVTDKYGVRISTSDGKWYISTSSVTYSGKVTFTFNSLNLTNSLGTFTWGTPKTFEVTIE